MIALGFKGVKLKHDLRNSGGYEVTNFCVTSDMKSAIILLLNLN